MTKKIITRSEAEDKVREANDTLFTFLEEHGIVVEEGQPDGAGVPFTAVRVEEIRGGIDTAAWALLETAYTIVDDDESFERRMLLVDDARSFPTEKLII